MPFIRRACFLILLISSGNLIAATDTTRTLQESATTHFFTLNQFSFPDSFSFLQNSLYRLENYLPKTFTGNSGRICNPLSYSQSTNDLGFGFSTNNFTNYFYSPNNLKFYNTRVPYTDLIYIMGSRKEQYFKTTFSVNPKKNWNITGDFSRIRSDGAYVLQATKNNSFALSSNFRSENNRYTAAVGIIYNSSKSYENGGVPDDSVFLGSAAVDVELLGVNLNSAERKHVNRTAFLKQIINFGRKVADTSAKVNTVVPGSQLVISSSFDDTYQLYSSNSSDITSGYYDKVYFDSTKTFDSTYFNSLENELEWRRVDNGRRRGIVDQIGLSLSGKHQLAYTRQSRTDTTLSNILAGAGLYNTYSNHQFWWKLSAAYVVDGYNAGDYIGSLSLKKTLKDSSTFFKVNLRADLRTPDYIYLKYRSNHFLWDNDFDKTAQVGAEALFSMTKYDLEAGVAYTNYQNVLYFDNFAQAKQFDGSIAVLSAHLKKDFTLKNWHLDNNITYQYVPDSMVIRLPQFILDHSLYYQNDVLKGAAIVKIGVSVFYTSEYFANAYMPATSVFYLQDQQKYGNYPFLDFFISAKIRSAKLFFKIDHLNYGLTGNKYVLTPGYPYPVRTFKLGVSWAFFD